MPETEAGSDIGSLLRPSPDAIAGASAALTSAARDKSETDSRVIDASERTLDRDVKRVNDWQQQVEATGITAAKYPEWNAQEQYDKVHHDPVEAFSSLGSVFGILASAFTHAPMENAMNASAAAMNAIKANDDAAYDRAEKQYKQNLDLALKRHDIVRSEYQDAITLMKTNMSVGELKLHNAMVKYGDKQGMALAEAGLHDKLFERLDAMNKAADGLRESGLKVTEDSYRDAMFKQAKKNYEQIQDPAERAAAEYAAFQQFYGKENKDPIAQQGAVALLDKAAKEGRSPTVEEWTKLKRDLSPYGHNQQRFSTDQEIVKALEYEHAEAGKPPPTAAEIAEAVSKAKGRSGTTGAQNLTTDRQRAQDVSAYREELKGQKNEDGTPKYSAAQVADMAAKREAELKATSAAPSGNKIDQMKSRVNQIKYSTETIDKIEVLLKKHNALTGLGGKITRPAETISNIFGSSATDRHEFESLVSEVKEWAPRILTDSQGRPLSAEAGNIDKIVRGLNLGDTTAITADRLYQLKKLYQQMSKDTEQRMRAAPPGATAPDAPKPTGKQPWERDPIKGKVSEIESEEATA